MATRDESCDPLLETVRQEMEAGRSRSRAMDDALDKLLGLLAPPLIGFFRSRVPRLEDAEELTQEALRALWQGVLLHRGHIRRLERYAKRIAGNHIADYWERRKGSSRRHPKPLLAAKSLEVADIRKLSEQRKEREDPAAKAVKKERAAIIHVTIEALPDELDREIARLMLQGGTLRGVADELGVGVGKARHRYEKFVARLRRALGPSGACRGR